MPEEDLPSDLLLWARQRILRTCPDNPEVAPLREIVERVMTLHWDMAACKCWLCVAGRTVDCRPKKCYLDKRDEIRDGLATGK
jgi:hypothetical protein